MLVTLIGTDRRYDVQSLCLTFFPRENFTDDTRRNLTVTLSQSCAKAHFISDAGTFEAAEPLSDTFDSERFAVKKAVYMALSKATGKVSPWGIMTGIKPAVFYADLLKEYGSRADDVFENDYLVFPQKTELCKAVLKNRQPVLDAQKSNDAAFYISVPFCPSRCRYCSFVSSSTSEEGGLLQPYIEKLCEEIAEKSGFIKQNNFRITSVYIGGGTPTVLPCELLEKLLLAVQENIDFSSVFEYTVEAGRPDTFTSEKLLLMKRYGVSRISVNPQTLSDEVLKNIGRKHTVEDFFNAFYLAEKDFDVNVDLIAGLPGDTVQSFSSTIDKVIALSPSNITVHTLYVKRASDFALENVVDIENSEKSTAAMVEAAEKKCAENGYLPYYLYRQKNTVGNCENVGYSKKGKQCFYNVYMMDDLQPVIGAGANATTKLDEGKKDFKRYCNTKFAYNYIKNT